MRTQLADFIRNTPRGKEADAILRSCVHCGFCTATCPTYQLLGDEDDGPRGRIYLIKAVLEGHPASEKTQQHLDRCLTCRACETTCPSGVNYHRLLDIGRAEVEQQVRRPLRQRLIRQALMTVFTRPWLFTPLLRIGQLLRPLLPQALQQKIPPRRHSPKKPPLNKQRRTMLTLDGCVQPAIAPNINAATERVLNALGVNLQAAPKAGCCGALRFHLNAEEPAKNDMRRNIDAWWPMLQAGAEAIIVNASGCSVQVKAYGELLAGTADAERAQLISQRCLDLSEVIANEEAALLEKLSSRRAAPTKPKVAFHSPCTLQHGQKQTGVVERLLSAAGYELLPVSDSHLCCGSAGTYSILQPALSARLRDNKLQALTAHQPDVIATANIGCLSHMSPIASQPVKHWIELIDEALAAR